MAMDKHLLRQDVLRQRDVLTAREVAEASAAIARRFVKTPFYLQASSILIYYPKGKEVNTEPIIQHALRSGKTVALPVTDPATRTLQLFAIRNPDADLVTGNYGIKEPRPDRCMPIALRDIDLVVAPAVAVDTEGNRLGYGLGYYDRLLASYDGLIALVVYNLQVLFRIPADPHDVLTQYVVTESRLIECNKLNK